MPREDISTWYKKRYEADVLSGKIRDTNLNNARQLFQSLQATKDSWNQRSGKLNTKQLVRASVGDKYVFKQDKTKRVLKNTCVQILVDISGSMNGEKVIYAAHTSLQIIKLCDIFHLDSEVIGFTTSGAKLVHILYKVFGKRFKCPDYYLSRFWDSLEEGLCQNNDGDSIMFGRERLLKTGKNKRKIMFVLSDGMPSGPRGDILTYTEDVIKMIESEKYMEIYGIGMLDDYVKHLYKDYAVVGDISKLEETLLSFFERVMFNK